MMHLEKKHLHRPPVMKFYQDAYVGLSYMPMMDGKDCLQPLKSNPAFSTISAITLSTTLREKDVGEFHAMGAID